MAISDKQNDYIAEASTTGASPHISLPPRPDGGFWKLSFRSSGAFALDLQESDTADDSDWVDAYNENSTKAIVNTATPTAQSFIVAAGNYRMNVTSYNSTIQMRAKYA